jgi:predicted HAD superfamily Cof-like phosphohydrolase
MPTTGKIDWINEALIQEIQSWARETFPAQMENPRRIMSHLHEEQDELDAAFNLWMADHDATKIAGEIADCLMLLYVLADATGVDVGQCLYDKHQINLARTWADSGKGHDKHVKEKC